LAWQTSWGCHRQTEPAVAQTYGGGRWVCAGLGIDLAALFQRKDVFKNVCMFEDYANKMLTKDEWRKGFAVYENTITGPCEACKPEVLGRLIGRSVAVFLYLRGVLDAIIEQTDIDAVALRVGELLDESFVVDDGGALKDSSKPEFRIKQSGGTWDLSKVNFDKLQPLSPLCLTRETVSARARPVLLRDLLRSWTLLRGHKRVIC
jgi:type I restriction enzyme R subunit